MKASLKLGLVFICWPAFPVQLRSVATKDKKEEDEEAEDEELVQHQLEERLYKGLVACLTKEEYKLGMDVHLDRDSRIFFFMKTCESRLTREVRLPGMVGAGLGEKESLAVYKPMLKRQKSSFLRSFRKKPTVSNRLRRQVQASLRRKVENPTNKKCRFSNFLNSPL